MTGAHPSKTEAGRPMTESVIRVPGMAGDYLFRVAGPATAGSDRFF